MSCQQWTPPNHQQPVPGLLTDHQEPLGPFRVNWFYPQKQNPGPQWPRVKSLPANAGDMGLIHLLPDS